MVIACKEKDRVLVAFDTQRTYGELKYRGAIGGSGGNVQHFRRGITIGFAGATVVKEALTFHEEWFDALGDEKLTKRFLVTEIMPALFLQLSARGQLDEDSLRCGRAKMDGTFLIAQGNELFYLDSDFSVLRVKEYAVIGRGSVIALGYLDGLEASANKGSTMLQALRDAGKRLNTLSGPYYLTDTAKREFVCGEADI